MHSINRRLYGNYSVLSPDGILMFRCDEKRANWYLSRDIAEMISEDPPIVQLNFTPRGLGNHDRGWGLAEMENRCVNCGIENNLTRHHVVPHTYRKHFPNVYKSRNFHDVLPMCIECHENYELEATKLKMELAERYDAPINGITSKNDSKAIKYARSLIRQYKNKYKHPIPDEKVKDMEQEVREYLGIQEFTFEDIQKLAKTKTNVVLKSHGEMVMDKINNIQEFIEMWRQHFVDNNDCEYMPIEWDIENEIIIKED